MNKTIYQGTKSVIETNFLVCSTTRSIKWSKSITINDSGVVSLNSPSSLNITASWTGARDLAEKSPCYITNLEGGPSKVFLFRREYKWWNFSFQI